MLDFLYSVFQLAALALCLFLIRGASLSVFIRNRIFRLRGKDYYFNNRRRSKLESYLFVGFENLMPAWLYWYNFSWTAFSALISLLMLIGYLFMLKGLCIFTLALFMYQVLLSLVLALLYYIPPKKLVRKWCFFGTFGATILNIPLTIILWNICF